MVSARSRQLLAALQLLCSALGCLACFSGQRQTAKVDENPMTEWSQWAECSLPCGDGKQARWRASVINEREREVESRTCGQVCSEVFAWADWEDWSNCSQTCGFQGVRSRYRKCRRISDGSVETHRLACPGDWMQAESCNQIECPPVYIWGPWEDWTPCTKTCGPGGRQDRGRQCQTERLQPTDLVNCGDDGRESRACNEEVPCPIVPEWQPWSEWSACPVTCGAGTLSRTRERRCPQDAPAGLCIPPDPPIETESRSCDLPACPAVNGGWSQWNSWSNCLATCGWSNRFRNRVCNNPPPSADGLDCGSSSVGLERCLGGTCPVDGQWGSWAPCSNIQGSPCATLPRGLCKPGWAMYCRPCDTPKPEFGGSPCVTGPATERRECWNTDACDNSIVQPPMNFQIVGFLNSSDLVAVWFRAPYGLSASSFFIAWTVAGTEIAGSAELQVVSPAEQKILGERYTHWVRDLALNSVVNFTIATRSTAGGFLRVSETLTQSFRVSRVDGAWGEWSQYGSCSPTSDCNIPGTHQRTRNCDSPEPANGGLECPGSAIENSRCFHAC